MLLFVCPSGVFACRVVVVLFVLFDGCCFCVLLMCVSLLLVCVCECFVCDLLFLCLWRAVTCVSSA